MISAVMHTRRLSRPCGLLLVAAILTTAAASPALAISPEAQRQRHALITSANANWEAQRFELALQDYERAYALLPHPDLLYRLGLTYERLDQPRRARETFERYLLEVPDTPYAPRIQARIVLLTEQERGAMPLLTLKTAPPGATLLVDGTPARGVTPVTLPVSPGTRQLTLRLEGYQEEVSSVTISPGELLEREVTLTPIIEPDPEPEPEPPALEQEPEEEVFEEPPRTRSREWTTVNIAPPVGMQALAYGLIAPGTASLALGTLILAIDGAYSAGIALPLILAGGASIGAGSYILFIHDWSPRFERGPGMSGVMPREGLQREDRAWGVGLTFEF